MVPKIKKKRKETVVRLGLAQLAEQAWGSTLAARGMWCRERDLTRSLPASEPHWLP